MKKGIGIGVMIVFLCSGCYTTKVMAPPEKRFSIAGYQKCEKVSSRKVWYLLWGLVPLSDNTTAHDLLLVPEGSAVKIEDKFTFVDLLISFVLTGGLIDSKTLKVYVCEEPRKPQKPRKHREEQEE
jgi:hypothetical protein